MGKTSLILRIVSHAVRHGYKTVILNFQLADKSVFANFDKFLRWFCASITRRLELPNQLSAYWEDDLGSSQNCTIYFEDYLLQQVDSPIVLALDELDQIYSYHNIAQDFMGMLRVWHEEAKTSLLWRKLRLIVAYSGLALFSLNINTSPFNVGKPIELPEFTSKQVRDLARLYKIDLTVVQVAQLMDMVGGHPYLVHHALNCLNHQDITLDKLLKTASTETGIYSDHLRQQLLSLQQHPELVTEFSKVLTALEPVKLDPTVAFKLNSMGLVNLDGSNVTSRCKLYHQYFRKWLMPSSNPINNNSEVDYTRLQTLLATKKWQDADHETATILLKVTGHEKRGWLGVEDIKQLSCVTLITIDQLWMKYSENHFGLSVQQGIWQNLAKIGYEPWLHFCNSVGWRKRDTWIAYGKLTFTLDAPKGHLPYLRGVIGIGMRSKADKMHQQERFYNLISRFAYCNKNSDQVDLADE